MAACEADALIRAGATLGLSFAPPGVGAGYALGDTASGGFSPIQGLTGYARAVPGGGSFTRDSAASFFNTRIIGDTAALLKDAAWSTVRKGAASVFKTSFGIGAGFAIYQAYKDSSECAKKCDEQYPVVEGN